MIWEHLVSSFIFTICYEINYVWPADWKSTWAMILASEMQFNDLEIDFLTNFIRFPLQERSPLLSVSPFHHVALLFSPSLYEQISFP